MPVEDAGGACERGADEERDDDDAVDVDAHHRRGFPVERRRAHRLARLRALHEQRERDHQDDRPDDDDHLWEPDVNVPRQGEPLRPESGCSAS